MVKLCLLLSVICACIHQPKSSSEPANNDSVKPSVEIVWDSDSLRRVSDERYDFSAYGRMIELRDGALLCVYEAEGSIIAVKSHDQGDTWGNSIPVAWKQDGINMAVPDVLELQDGSILVCYNPRPYKISGARCFGIRTRKSADGGRTWNHGRLIYEAGHKFHNGCWEPAAIQLPDGEIQVYFANENPFRRSDEQNISMLSSRDGGLTWTAEPEIVSYRPFARDGMPSPLVLADKKEIVCAIEDTGWMGIFKPAIVRTSIENSWSEPVGICSDLRDYAYSDSLGFFAYAGAPCLRQLPTGETLLSYQGTEGRRNHMAFAEMKVLVGDSEARNFGNPTTPFQIPTNRSALWNGLTVLKNGTIIALTTTSAFSNKNEIWMIKGHARKFKD